MGNILETEGPYLLKVARETIKRGKKEVWLKPEEIESLSDQLKEDRGCFVTLTIGGHLRGCIGYIQAIAPLYQAIIENSYNAAYKDPRFRPVTPDEIPSIHIELSVLTNPVKLEYDGAEDLLQKLTPDLDGVIIKKGFASATFLPQVWEQLPMKEDFLEHLCQKAGLSKDEWKSGELEVELYRVEAIEEES